MSDTDAVKLEPCPECDGEGEVSGYDPGGFPAMFSCRACDGAGTVTPPKPLPPIDTCPFCKCADAFVERADLSSAYVMCNDCGAKGPTECQESDDEETPGAANAIAAWNRRAGLEAVRREALEKAAAALEERASFLKDEGFAGDASETRRCAVIVRVLAANPQEGAAEVEGQGKDHG